MSTPAISPEAELLIKRQVDDEFARRSLNLEERASKLAESATKEVTLYREHLERSLRLCGWGVSILFAVASVAFTYLFGKTKADLITESHQLRAELRNEVSDTKQESREAIKEAQNTMTEQIGLMTRDAKIEGALYNRIQELIDTAAEKAQPQMDQRVKQTLETPEIQSAIDARVQKAIEIQIAAPRAADEIVKQIGPLAQRALETEGTQAKIESAVKAQAEKMQISQDQFMAMLRSALPIGSILSSMLPPDQFRNEQSKAWVLADGSLTEGTEYKKLTGQDRLPDLRGMFLRGMNQGRDDEFRDPDPNRKAGQPQGDEFKAHTHAYGDGAPYRGGASGKRVDWNGYAATYKEYPPPFATASAGAEETRPKNAAVYFYIKVN